MRRRRLSILAVLSSCLVLAVAHAAPAKKVRVPSAFGGRLAQTVSKNGTSLTRAQIVEKFDPDGTVDLGGSKISVQELMDRVEASETHLATKGASLTHLKKTAWHKPTTVTKLAAQKAALATETTEIASAKPTITAGQSPASCTLQSCVPRDKEKTIKLEKQKGDEDTVAVYTSFALSEQTPSGDAVRCTATWDNGAWLLGNKQSLVKLTGEASGQKKPTVQTAGRVALYVAGQASPVWSKDGKVTGDLLDRTFKTPKFKMTVDFIPLVGIEGSIQSSATLSLKPTVTSNGDATSVGCDIGITPRLVVEVDPEAKIVVGIPKLVELAEGGVKAKLTAVDVSLPTSLGVKMTEQPLALGVKLKSDVKATFLKGKVVAWYKIKDVCAWGYCLIEDGLGIDTSGEVTIWEDADGIPYSHNLADLDASIPFQSGMGGVKVAK